MFLKAIDTVSYYAVIGSVYGLIIGMATVFTSPNISPAIDHEVGAEQNAPQTVNSEQMLVVHDRAKTSQKSVVEPVSFGIPSRIVLDSVGIDIEVDKGYFDPESKTWTLSDSKAYFALPSTKPNDSSGNTLIYGHNNRHVFARLHRLKEGEMAEVHTDKGYVFRYSLYSRGDVRPANVNIFDYKGKAQLTLQTCSGNWDGLRRFYTFEFSSVEQQNGV